MSRTTLVDLTAMIGCAQRVVMLPPAAHDNAEDARVAVTALTRLTCLAFDLDNPEDALVIEGGIRSQGRLSPEDVTYLLRNHRSAS